MKTQPTNSINPLNWNRADWIDVVRIAFHVTVGIVVGAILF